MNQEGRVVKILDDARTVVINLGARDGVCEGMRFLVFCYGEELNDPESGEPLGRLEIVRGIGRAKHVQERMTTLTSELTRTETVRRLIPGFEPVGFRMKWAQEEDTTEVVKRFEGVQVNDLVRQLSPPEKA